jgi:hypothetical protein
MKGTIRVRAAGALPTDPPTDTIVATAPVEAHWSASAAVVGVAAAFLLLAFLVPRRRRSH